MLWGFAGGGAKNSYFHLHVKANGHPEDSWRRLNTDIPLAESTGAAGFEAQGMRGNHEYMPAVVLLPSFAICSWPLLQAGKKAG